MRIYEQMAIAGLAALFMVLPFPVFAQTSSIRVIVRDGSTLGPIPGALLTISTTDFAAQSNDKDMLGFLSILASPLLSDANGIATFQSLPSGSYRVLARRDGYLGVADDGSATSKGTSSPIITLGDGQTTPQYLLLLNPAPRFGGRVLDSRGVPVPNACVDLGTIRLQNGRELFVSGPTAYSDAQGEYRMEAGSPGDYSIRVRSAVSPQAMIYYPGIRDLEKATVISIGTSQQRMGIDIVLPGDSTPTPLPDSLELIHQSDFVGFVSFDPAGEAVNPTGEWRQRFFLQRVDPLKDSMTREPSNSQPLRVSADNVSVSGFPTWFSEKGEYLVFLKRGTPDGQDAWTTTAAFHVEYRPDSSGQIIGTLFGDPQDRQRMSALQVRSILERALSNNVDGSDLQSLNTRFRAAAASQCSPDGPRRPISSEERLLEVQQLSVAIPLGSTRADIDRMFTQYDNFNGGEKYYVNPGVKVEVPYDNTGGHWNPANRVIGQIKVTHGTALVD